MSTTQPDHFLILDVSKFENAPIPLAALTELASPLLVARITQGVDEVDALFDQHHAVAIQAGVPVVAYHALLPGDEERQADFYAAQVIHRGLVPGVAGHAVDWEIGNGDVFLFINRLRVNLPGVRIGLYASPSFYNDRIAARPFPGDWPWVAQWIGEPRTGDPAHSLTDGGPDGDGVTPLYWTPFEGCEHYVLRQFTSSASVAGFGPLDVSVTYLDHADLFAALGVTGAPATPTPEPTTPTSEGFDVNPPQIQQDATGQPVKLLQGLLLSHGYGPQGLVGASGLPDGIFGPQTHEIVTRYQADRALAKDGIVGPITWRDLFVAGL